MCICCYNHRQPGKRFVVFLSWEETVLCPHFDTVIFMDSRGNDSNGQDFITFWLPKTWTHYHLVLKLFSDFSLFPPLNSHLLKKVGTLTKYNNYIRAPRNDKGRLEQCTLAYYRCAEVVFGFSFILFRLTSSRRSLSEHSKRISPCGAAKGVIQVLRSDVSCAIDEWESNEWHVTRLVLRLLHTSVLLRLVLLRHEVQLF